MRFARTLTTTVAAAALAAAAAVPAAATAIPSPAGGTPHLPTSGGFANIAALAGCGGKIYAGGKFTRILSHGKTISRNGLFSFSASSPWNVTGWNPNIGGTVDAITFAGSCSKVIIGGAFHTVHGAAAHDIAAVNTSTGALVGSFGHSASATVNALASWHGHVIAGGAFRSINGTSRCCLASLSASTGKPDGYITTAVSGGKHQTMVGAMAVSHNSSALVASGDFSKPRPQAFMLRAGGSHPSVTGFTSPGFATGCDRTFWARGLAWSGDDSTVYVAATGQRTKPFHLPLTGLCDALSAIPAGGGSPRWTDYTGCDSLYSDIEAGGVVFAGGHQRWFNNRNACNKRGPGAVPDPGLWGVHASGSLVTSGGRPAYFMSKANADTMLDFGGHVIVGSSNRLGSDTCQGTRGVSGLCVLPVP